jgi:hypothetical protein
MWHERECGSVRRPKSDGSVRRLPQRWAHPCHICTGAGLTSGHIGTMAGLTSGQGLGSPVPHLHRDWAHAWHICTGTRLICATRGLDSTRPHLQRYWAHPCYICTGIPRLR